MPPLKKLISLTLLSVSAAIATAAELTFTGLRLQVVKETPAASTGLTEVYVLPYVEGVKASFESTAGNTVSWQRFSKLGGGYAEPAPSTQNGSTSTLDRLEGNMGYIVADGSTSFYFWVVDYSAYPMGLRDLTLSPESDCSTTWLDVDGNGDGITYYSITGVPQHIDRQFTLSYSTLEYDETEKTWRQTTHEENFAELTETLTCPPPLCETAFTLSGDKFARIWGEEESITSPVYEPRAVEAHTSAEQTPRQADNEVKEEAALGGSGPAEVTFTAAVTDAAVFHEWELARDSEFNQSFLRYSDLEFTHTFREQGTTYVRFTAANDDGTCEYVSETYEVYIGESSLKCPNAFSPGTSEGVNDEWKVSYKSIVEFDCHIFDRNGRKLAHLTDPSQGWDGKINGKTAPSGVYFYVIRAKGADGKKYNLNGNINIIGFKKNNSTNNGTE